MRKQVQIKCRGFNEKLIVILVQNWKIRVQCVTTDNQVLRGSGIHILKTIGKERKKEEAQNTEDTWGRAGLTVEMKRNPPQKMRQSYIHRICRREIVPINSDLEYII